MSRLDPRRQPDLFAKPEDLFDQAPAASPSPEPLPDDFVRRIRAELHATLDLVRGAEFQPWADLTAMTLEEMGFRSRCTLLPPEEGAGLRAAFDAEMDRIYANEDARWEAQEGARGADDAALIARLAAVAGRPGSGRTAG